MVENSLKAQEEKDYGEYYKSHLFEQYKLYVDSIEKTSDRRQQTNSYFIGINTALITLIGLSLEIDALKDSIWLRPIISLLGVIISVVFWFLIRSYKQLNSGKFQVIHEIEELLPLKLYVHEWNILEKGKNYKKYYPFSHIELLIPWVFAMMYIVIGIIFCLSS